MVTLKDIDIQIKHGEFVCVIGDVGSGKSSLLSAIIGDLLYVSPGQISKYGGKYGFEKEINNDDEVQHFQKDLIENTRKMKANPPIEINGKLAYVQ